MFYFPLKNNGWHLRRVSEENLEGILVIVTYSFPPRPARGICNFLCPKTAYNSKRLLSFIIWGQEPGFKNMCTLSTGHCVVLCTPLAAITALMLLEKGSISRFSISHPVSWLKGNIRAIDQTLISTYKRFYQDNKGGTMALFYSKERSDYTLTG